MTLLPFALTLALGGPPLNNEVPSLPSNNYPAEIPGHPWYNSFTWDWLFEHPAISLCVAVALGVVLVAALISLTRRLRKGPRSINKSLAASGVSAGAIVGILFIVVSSFGHSCSGGIYYTTTLAMPGVTASSSYPVSMHLCVDQRCTDTTLGALPPQVLALVPGLANQPSCIPGPLDSCIFGGPSGGIEVQNLVLGGAKHTASVKATDSKGNTLVDVNKTLHLKNQASAEETACHGPSLGGSFTLK